MKKGIKYDLNKLKWDLLPISPLEEVIKVLMIGSEKYFIDNWKFVNNFERRYYNASMRHLSEYYKYLDSNNNNYLYDNDTGLHHLAHLLCNGIFLLWKEIQKGNIDYKTWESKLLEIKNKYKKKEGIKNER